MKNVVQFSQTKQLIGYLFAFSGNNSGNNVEEPIHSSKTVNREFVCFLQEIIQEIMLSNSLKQNSQ